MLTQHFFLGRIIDLQCCNYCQFPSDFSCTRIWWTSAYMETHPNSKVQLEEMHVVDLFLQHLAIPNFQLWLLSNLLCLTLHATFQPAPHRMSTSDVLKPPQHTPPNGTWYTSPNLPPHHPPSTSRDTVLCSHRWPSDTHGAVAKREGGERERGTERGALSSGFIQGECPPRTQRSDSSSEKPSTPCNKFAAMPRVRSFCRCLWGFCEVSVRWFSQDWFCCGNLWSGLGLVN